MISDRLADLLQHLRDDDATLTSLDLRGMKYICDHREKVRIGVKEVRKEHGDQDEIESNK